LAAATNQGPEAKQFDRRDYLAKQIAEMQRADRRQIE
jgi:hypothetical protein